MPWKTVRDDRCPAGKPFGVVQETTDELVACHETEADAQAQLRALYANEPQTRSRQGLPIEIRSAAVDDVNFPLRTVTLIAVPYEQRTLVPYRNEVWEEVVCRGAFDGIEASHNGRIYKVNRDHDRKRTCGKITGYYPNRNEGLIVDAYISATALGDETLQLASDGVLGGSVGMAVPPQDQVMDRRSKLRTIKRAFLDHLAFVPDPAYVGAEVIGVRSDMLETEDLPPMPAMPAIDQFLSDPIFAWARTHLEERASDGDGPPKPYGNVRYADPTNGKYPIDTEAHVRAAWSYINMPKNQGGYSSSELAAIKGRIKARAKELGIEISEDNK